MLEIDIPQLGHILLVAAVGFDDKELINDVWSGKNDRNRAAHGYDFWIQKITHESGITQYFDNVSSICIYIKYISRCKQKSRENRTIPRQLYQCKFDFPELYSVLSKLNVN